MTEKYSPVHLNGNLLCAIDVETTGLDEDKHEIWEIAILPLDMHYKPSRVFNFFHMIIRPEYPDRISDDIPKGSKDKINKAILNGIETYTAIERFEEWFQKLGLPENKKIVPLGHNFSAFDSRFIRKWLGGPANYEQFFRSDVRDSLNFALAMNDLAFWRGEQIPYPKYTLSYLCALLHVENPSPHEAMSDCLATAGVYRRLLEDSMAARRAVSETNS